MKRVLIVAAALSAASCSFIKKNVTVEGNVADAVRKIQDLRKDLTPENEYYVGRSVATNILAKNDYRYVGAAEIAEGRMDPLTEYVNQVGQIVVAAAMERNTDSDRPAPIAGWHFIVVDDDRVNATAAPGGFVFVTTGALRLARSEDELAGLIAHEIAHVVRGHALGSIKKSRYAKMSKDLLDSTVQINGEGITQLTGLMEGGIDDMLDAMFVKGYSKDTEFEADRIGMELATKAGYDPRAMIAYLQRMQKNQDTGDGGFYATHPKASDRITKLKEKLPKTTVAVP
ncbi:MAG TPA: M48 family metallopeptidase, partial [Kofleriaceae bacterium]|nr:M48 family metallopeptidase [Kofleriaceae bacterium]